MGLKGSSFKSHRVRRKGLQFWGLGFQGSEGSEGVVGFIGSGFKGFRGLGWFTLVSLPRVSSEVELLV